MPPRAARTFTITVRDDNDAQLFTTFGVQVTVDGACATPTMVREQLAAACLSVQHQIEQHPQLQDSPIDTKPKQSCPPRKTITLPNGMAPLFPRKERRRD